MAEYVTVSRELQRMCDKNRCAECPITKFRHAFVNCHTWMDNHPEEVERIVMAWSAEHPPVTNGMKFREVFGEDMMAMLTGEHAPLDDWLDAEYKGGQHGDN